MNPNHEVEIEVTAANQFSSYEILPKSLNITSTRAGNTIRFKLKEANQFVTFVFDDNYDDKDHPGQLDERSVMTICCLESTYFSNIRFEDIRVNRCERLICLTFKDSFRFGSIPGNQTTEGGIDGVTFKNITVTSKGYSSIANDILLNGWQKEGTPTKYYLRPRINKRDLFRI